MGALISHRDSERHLFLADVRWVVVAPGPQRQRQSAELHGLQPLYRKFRLVMGEQRSVSERRGIFSACFRNLWQLPRQLPCGAWRMDGQPWFAQELQLDREVEVEG